MINRLRKKILVLILPLCLLCSGASAQTETTQQRSELSVIIQDEIIQQGIHEVEIEQHIIQDQSCFLSSLETWYNSHPLIEFASLIEPSITIKFIDGSYTVILDPFTEKDTSLMDSASSFFYEQYGNDYDSTAVILNAAEYMYGHRQCRNIITTLLRHQYSIEYLANQAVDLSYIRYNLTADVIYMNTHAGYFDVDGDQQADAVVIATGELWTNETEQKYAFDYQNKLIVKGMVGDQGVVAFTPAFIDHYYAPGDLPNSLVYMATCFATYDASMAQEFIDAGASVYVGWSQNTMFWTNSKISICAFHLLASGFTVHQVCTLIRSGGFYNWLFHSKLIYYGDGEHRIPR
jgi:hypothetical protein